MRILALDPSSSCVGYAVLTGLEPAELIDGGLIKPSQAKRVTADLPPWLSERLRAPSMRAVHGIYAITATIDELIAEHAPATIVVEVPSGKAGTGSRQQRAGGGLTTLGLAAGAVLERCRHAATAIDAHDPPAVVPVTERQWTSRRSGPGARGPKYQSQAAIAALYRGRYDPAADPGADLADAIALARWWLQRDHAVSA